MDIRRVVLSMALAFLGLSLWNAWQADYPAKNEASAITVTQSDGDKLLPGTPAGSEQPAPGMVESGTTALNPADLIKVKTDVLDIAIDPKEGDIVSGQLLAYPLSVEDKHTPFTLLQDNANGRYVANSSLFTVNNQQLQPLTLQFSSEKTEYQLAPDQSKLIVSLKGRTADNLSVEKQFIFTKNSYLIDVRYLITNQGTADWKGYLNTQLLRSATKEDKSSMFQASSYIGASYSNPNKSHYQKVSFDNMTKNNLDVDAKGGWIAMQQHYFLSAWIPDADSDNKFYTRAHNNIFTIGAVSHPISVKPEEEKTVSSRLYLGPENISVLKSIAPSLDLTVDYGILWFLSSLLFTLMKSINSFVGNWGWSIVLVTVLIKLAFYRLSATSYKSMASMRKLQPKLQALRERYGDDKARISQETMKLYKEEKVNPLGGCLPILIQIPVFIALYWVLLESVELRQAGFIFWIKDLAAPDPYHVLPVIMGITMLIQQRLNPAPPDPMQAKVMMFLPILFTGLFWNFPSGLVLYWIVNNTLSIIQQWYITRKYSDDKPVVKSKKTAVSTK